VQPEISELPPEVLEALAALLLRLNDEFEATSATPAAISPSYFL
jgi:hypothetical protein